MRIASSSALDNRMPASIVLQDGKPLLRYFAYLGLLPHKLGPQASATPDLTWIPAQLEQVEPIVAAMSTRDPQRIIPACDRAIEQLQSVIARAGEADVFRPLIDHAVQAFMAAGALRRMAEFWEEMACA